MQFQNDAAREERFKQRMEREIQILEKLPRHENIVGYEEWSWDLRRELLFIIMEYVEKGELYAAIIERQKFNETEASYVLRQLATGLQFLHSHGVVHRDLKPENFVA